MEVNYQNQTASTIQEKERILKALRHSPSGFNSARA